MLTSRIWISDEADKGERELGRLQIERLSLKIRLLALPVSGLTKLVGPSVVLFPVSQSNIELCT